MENKINTRKILDFIKENNLSKTALCKKSNICYSTFQKLLEGKENISVIAVYKLARYMNVNLCDLFTE